MHRQSYETLNKQKWKITKPNMAYLKRNWRLRLETSIRSMSITSRFRKPERAKSLRSSHPKPPAPTTNTLAYSRRSSLNYKQTTTQTQTSRTTSTQNQRKHALQVFVKIPEREEEFERERESTSGPGSKLGPTRWPCLRRSLSRSRDRLICAIESAIEGLGDFWLKYTHTGESSVCLKKMTVSGW